MFVIKDKLKMGKQQAKKKTPKPRTNDIDILIENGLVCLANNQSLSVRISVSFYYLDGLKKKRTKKIERKEQTN